MDHNFKICMIERIFLYMMKMVTKAHLYLVNIIKKQLTTMLPDYMIPQEIVAVEIFPLNINGKVDRNQLLLFREKQPC